MLLLESLGIAHIRFNTFWPLIVIAVGFLMIWRAVGRSEVRMAWPGLVANISARAGPAIPARNSTMSQSSVASSGAPPPRNSKVGTILAIFGGFQIDLRQADIEGDSAAIEAMSLMGGGEIKVPYSWDVSMEGIGLFMARIC